MGLMVRGEKEQEEGSLLPSYRTGNCPIVGDCFLANVNRKFERR